MSIEIKLIRSELERTTIVDEFTRYDIDFDKDYLSREYPYYIFYTKTESNGYPYIMYTELDIDSVNRMKDNLERSL